MTPEDPDLNALRLWLALRRHRAGPATVRDVNRLLPDLPVLDRPLTVANAFEACVLIRQAALDQADPALSFRYATVSHACGMVAFWHRYGGSLAVEHHGDRYVIEVGDRRAVFDVAGPQFDLHFDFFFVHEPGLWAWLADLTPDDVLLDVGADVGLYSVGAAALRRCRVVGLEPVPANAVAASANVAANGLGGLVEILPVAAAEGTAIDDLVAGGAIPLPTRVRIDVDGGEDAVIAGMQRTLADRRLDSLHMAVRWWEPDGQAVVDAVCRHGFRARVSDDRKNLLFRRAPAPAAATPA